MVSDQAVGTDPHALALSAGRRSRPALSLRDVRVMHAKKKTAEKTLTEAVENLPETHFSLVLLHFGRPYSCAHVL